MLNFLPLLTNIYKRRGEHDRGEKIWKEVLQSYERAGDHDDEVEHTIAWSQYFLLAQHAFYTDTLRKPEVKGYLETALRATKRLNYLRAQLIERIRYAETAYSATHLHELALLDFCSLEIFTLWNNEAIDTLSSQNDQAHFRLAIQTPLPTYFFTICNALLDWHYYPDGRYLGLAMMLQQLGDFENAQIAFELLFSRTDPESGFNKEFTCDMCSSKIAGGKCFVCKICKDVLLDPLCFDKYQSMERSIMAKGLGASGCMKHGFFQVPRAEWSDWDYETVNGSGQTLTRWLGAMRNVYGEIEVPANLINSLSWLESLT